MPCYMASRETSRFLWVPTLQVSVSKLNDCSSILSYILLLDKGTLTSLKGKLLTIAYLCETGLKPSFLFLNHARREESIAIRKFDFVGNSEYLFCWWGVLKSFKEI